MRLVLLALAVAASAAIAVVVLARGDDTPARDAAPADVTSSASAAPGRSSWAANADAACATLLRRFHAAMHPGSRSGIEVFTEAARLGHTDLAIFEGISPPRAARQGADVLAAALAVQLIALEELARAEDESNEGRARIALDRARDARRRLRPFAAELGLSACTREAERR
jgi:hypothetical protein